MASLGIVVLVVIDLEVPSQEITVLAVIDLAMAVRHLVAVAAFQVDTDQKPTTTY